MATAPNGSAAFDPFAPPVQATNVHDQSAVVQTDTSSSNQTQPVLSDGEKLELLGAVLDEVETSASVLDQVAPTALLHHDPLNPPQAGKPAPQRAETVGASRVAPEYGSTSQVEYEPSAELPVEVEGFLERVEDHTDKLPQEIVITDGVVQPVDQNQPTQQVVVLPVTEKQAEEKVRNVKLSLAWLIEWSHKIIKRFIGKVVYRHESNA